MSNDPIQDEYSKMDLKQILDAHFEKYGYVSIGMDDLDMLRHNLRNGEGASRKQDGEMSRFTIEEWD